MAAQAAQAEITASLGAARAPVPHLARRARPVTAIATPRGPLLCRCSTSQTDGGGAAEKTAKTPFVDTRIHWGSSDEGWLGMPDYPDDDDPEVSPEKQALSTWRTGQNDALMGLLVMASDSHYQRLELTPNATTEEIKASYRRLSKTFHPDTTALPLDLAADMFVRLRDAYTVLTSEEQRRYYDWQLAQKVAMQQSGRFIPGSEIDKTMADDGSRPAGQSRASDDDMTKDTVDRLGGRNMPLSGQAQTAIAFDAFAVIVSILAILYAIYLKPS